MYLQALILMSTSVPIPSNEGLVKSEMPKLFQSELVRSSCSCIIWHLLFVISCLVWLTKKKNSNVFLPRSFTNIDLWWFSWCCTGVVCVCLLVCFCVCVFLYSTDVYIKMLGSKLSWMTHLHVLPLYKNKTNVYVRELLLPSCAAVVI